MKTTCQHCQRCFDHQEVANAHTVFEHKEAAVTFSSIDDDLGIDVCQVCHKPPLLARLWHPFTKNKKVSEVVPLESCRPEMAIVIL